MYDAIFYEDERGFAPVADWIEKLRNQSYTSKDARINLNKVVAYIDVLCEKGTNKTPQREIDQAKRNFKNHIERNDK